MHALFSRDAQVSARSSPDNSTSIVRRVKHKGTPCTAARGPPPPAEDCRRQKKRRQKKVRGLKAPRRLRDSDETLSERKPAPPDQSFLRNADIASSDERAVHCYAEQICAHMRAVEVRAPEQHLHCAAKVDYLAAPAELSAVDRKACLEQVYDLAARHKVSRKALHAGVGIADRYLSLEPPASAGELLQIFVASLYMAIKLEEVEFPTQRHFLAGTRLRLDSLVDLEHRILETLDFQLYSPSAMAFFDLFAQSRGLPPEAYAFAQYVCEVVHYELALPRHKPSAIASGVLYLCSKAFLKRSWEPSLSRLTSYRKAEVLLVSEDLCRLLDSYWQAEVNSDCCLERKFAREQYRGVSTLRLIETAR